MTEKIPVELPDEIKPGDIWEVAGTTSAICIDAVEDSRVVYHYVGDCRQNRLHVDHFYGYFEKRKK